MKDLIEYSEYRLHKELQKAEKYTAEDVWNYFQVLWMGKGRNQGASYTTRQQLEDQRNYFLSRVVPADEATLEKFEAWARRWGLDTVLYAVEDAVAASDYEPDMDDVRARLSMAYGEIRRRIIMLGAKKVR